jgi:parvulin-like peptidyl-prolyl isomerase
MTRTVFILFLAAGTALAQTQTANPSPNAQAPKPSAQPSSGTQAPRPPSPQAGQQTPATAQKPVDSASSVAPSQPVVIARGVCDGAQKSGAATKDDVCETVLTMEQFDTLLSSLNSNNQAIPPAMRLKLAQAYVELLAYSDAAQKAGIDNTPAFKEVMRLVRMRTLADIFQRSLQEKFRNASPAEMEEYYNKNLPKFEEAKLRRLFIPRNNSSASNKEEFEKKAQQLAGDLRERLAKGEDPDVLEKEAYATLALEAKPMPTDFGSRRKGSLPPEQDAEIFSLSPGGATKVQSLSPGFVIYKVESRQTLPLDKVKDEISREIFRRKVEEENARIKASVRADYNEAYFGPVNAPSQTPPQTPPPPQQPK